MENVADNEQLPDSRNRYPRVAATRHFGRFLGSHEDGASGRVSAGADGAGGRAAPGKAAVGAEVVARRAGDEDCPAELKKNDNEKCREPRAASHVASFYHRR